MSVFRMDSCIDVIDLQTMTSMSPPEQIPTQGAWDPAYVLTACAKWLSLRAERHLDAGESGFLGAVSGRDGGREGDFDGVDDAVACLCDRSVRAGRPIR